MPNSVSIPIERYRANPTDTQWELPAWGHPISQGVLPLCITMHDHLFPVGSAFTVGRGFAFVISAAHNVMEALKKEERLNHLLSSRELPTSIDLRHAGICVLHQTPKPNGDVQLSVWPLETVDGAPPTDIVFGFPKFQEGLGTLSLPLSFDLPIIGERIWSIGYSHFEFPEHGIPLDEIRRGNFDWQTKYSHKLTVVDGRIERIFTRRFLTGFVDGPCFTFDANIPHALSGGPILSRDGVVRGVNSAGAALYFGQPTSIGSLLYPLLLTKLRFGAQIGPLRLNANHPLISLIANGKIATDGSEERVGITRDPTTGELGVNPRALNTQQIYDDLASSQGGMPATRAIGDVYTLKRPPEYEAS